MEDKEVYRTSDVLNSSLNENSFNFNKEIGGRGFNSKKKDFNCLFAFDSSKNEYELNTEISELDEKNAKYITDTIHKFNSELKSKTSYVPCYMNILYVLGYFASGLLFLVLLYISILFCALCLFNPMIIIAILFFGLTKGVALMYFIHCKIQDNRKSKKINALINRENQEQAKQGTKYVWNNGRDGSWIEVKIPLRN